MRAKTAAGLGLLLSSIVLFAGGSYVVFATVDQQARQDRQWQETDAQCVSLLKTIAGAEVGSGSDMTVVIRNVVDPRKSLTDATTAVLMCPGRKMTEMCLGDKCVGSQDKVVLRFKMREIK
ncbi:hypothetical protein G6L37_04140 [Agrobacterium rubi]|nr:hypothetical protein [Agrobacterium rubi]NTF24541.1 hypothetical protein [Agrobacterium rubi]